MVLGVSPWQTWKVTSILKLSGGYTLHSLSQRQCDKGWFLLSELWRKVSRSPCNEAHSQATLHQNGPNRSKGTHPLRGERHTLWERWRSLSSAALEPRHRQTARSSDGKADSESAASGSVRRWSTARLERHRCPLQRQQRHFIYGASMLAGVCSVGLNNESNSNQHWNVIECSFQITKAAVLRKKKMLHSSRSVGIIFFFFFLNKCIFVIYLYSV